MCQMIELSSKVIGYKSLQNERSFTSKIFTYLAGTFSHVLFNLLTDEWSSPLKAKKRVETAKVTARFEEKKN